MSRLLQSQVDTKFNVLNFTIDGYIEYVAKVNDAPLKEKFSENRRLELQINKIEAISTSNTVNVKVKLPLTP